MRKKNETIGCYGISDDRIPGQRKDPVSDIYVGAGLFSDPGEDASDPL